MGDVRFDAALEQVEKARREGNVEQVSPETGIQALGALAAAEDGVLANVLTTRLLNQVRRSATLLRFVAEGVVALDGDGIVLYANPAAERMLGQEEGGLRGRRFHDTVHHGKMDGEDVAREDCALLRTLEAGTHDRVWVNDHDTFRRRDGSTFLVGFSAAAITVHGEPTGVAVVFRDITREKEHEAELKLHRAALDAVPEPVFWLDHDGSILYVNVAASDHLGYGRDELERMKVFDVDVDFPPDRWSENWERVRRDGIVRIESRHRTRDGEVVPVSIKVTHVEHDGRGFHVAVARRHDGR